MPYFFRIGDIASNKGGVGARGYHLFRRGSRVVAEYGPVEVYRSGPLGIYWAGSVVRMSREFRSEAKAHEVLAWLIAYRLTRHRDLPYRRMPRGTKIRGRPRITKRSWKLSATGPTR